MNIKKRSNGIALIISVLVASLSLSYVVFAAPWAGPTAAPPGNNTDIPLNVGDISQVKSGGLILNTGGAVNGLSVASGKVGIGTLSPDAKLHVLGVSDTDNDADNVYVQGISNNPNYNPSLVFRRSRGNSIATMAPVQNGDTLMEVLVRGYNNGSFNETANIRMSVDGAVGAAAKVPSRIDFFTTNSTGVENMNMTVKNDGKVGIGTASPQSLLHLKGTSEVDVMVEGNSPDIKFIDAQDLYDTWRAGLDNDTGNFEITLNQKNSLPASNPETKIRDVLTIKPDGNVGIGTGNPTAKLHLEGNSNTDLGSDNIILETVSQNADNSGNIWGLRARGLTNAAKSPVQANDELLELDGVGYVGVDGNKHAAVVSIYTDGPYAGGFLPGKIIFNTTSPTGYRTLANPQMILKSNGNVGLGTANPGSHFTIYGDAEMKLQSDSNPSNYSDIHFDNVLSGGREYVIGNYGPAVAFSTPNSFFIRDNAGSDRLIILPNGNVGIGMSTPGPGQKLEVAGKIKIGDDAVAGSAGTVRYNSTTNDFEGHNGTSWKSMTGGGAGAGLWAAGVGANINDIYNSNIGNVGIGTTNPSAKLHIDNGAVLFSGTIGATPVSGAGTRMIWVPAKSAFRAGKVDSGVWDDANIGDNSIAMGFNTTASGAYSTAIGYNSTASRSYSSAIGVMARATADYGVAIGTGAEASGAYSSAMGTGATASGSSSIALGLNTIASGSNSTAMGDITVASGSDSTAMGASTFATGDKSIAMGDGSKANGRVSTAVGYATVADGDFSTTMGRRITVANTGTYSFGIGLDDTINTITQPSTMAIMGGNVGIATTDPASKLDVNGGLKISDATEGIGTAPNYAGLYMPNTDVIVGGGNDAVFAFRHIDQATKNNLMIFGNQDIGGVVNGRVAMTIDSEYRRVGVGPRLSGERPNATLDVQMFDASAGEGLHISRNAAMGFSYLNIENELVNSIFKVHESGNVGIGDASPAGKLVVNGDPSGGNNAGKLTIFDYTANMGDINMNGGADSLFAFNNSGDAATGATYFRSSSSNRNDILYLRNDGNVGIGTPTPRATLDIVGDEVLIDEGSPEINFIDSGTTDVGWRFGGGTGNYFSIDSVLNGNWNTGAAPQWDMVFRYTPGGTPTTGSVNVGIGTNGDPLDKLQVAGDIRVGMGTAGCVKDADGSVISGTCSSDIRLKKNIAPLKNMLGAVSNLKPVSFNWRSNEYPEMGFGNQRQIGLIAQDVEKVMPELVSEDDKGFKRVNYSDLSIMMLQSIKELKAENDALKARLDALEAR